MESNKKDLNVAHITNINEDPLLSGKIYFNLAKKQKITFGRRVPKGED